MGFSKGWREHLFGRDMFAGTRCRYHDIAVHRGWRINDHRIDLRQRQQIKEMHPSIAAPYRTRNSSLGNRSRFVSDENGRGADGSETTG